jgi:hypothetical protein
MFLTRGEAARSNTPGMETWQPSLPRMMILPLASLKGRDSNQAGFLVKQQDVILSEINLFQYRVYK